MFGTVKVPGGLYMAFKLSASMIMAAVRLLWDLGFALKDGSLDDTELASVSADLQKLISTLEGVL